MLTTVHPSWRRASGCPIGNSSRFVAALACGAALAAPAAAQTYQYLGTFGTSGPGLLAYPNSVHIDQGTHRVFVSDAGHNRIVIYDTSGNYVGAFGSYGTADGQLEYPASIEVDPSTHAVIVADYFGNRVERFTSNGGFLSKFAQDNPGNACGVALQSTSGNILVSNAGGASVLVYDANGNYVTTFGGSGFGYLCDMVFQSSGHLLVNDQTQNRVHVFDANGATLGSFGSYGSGNGQFSSPGGITIEPVTGNIVVVDYGNNRVQIFDPNGNYLTQFGSSGIGPGQFNGPNGVAIDSVTHDMFVVDRGNNRVEKFSPCGSTLVSLSVLPLTQALGQEIFFSASIGNVESPSGSVAMYADDGSVVCTATTYGDPQAACSGQLLLGTHAVTAVYSGTGVIPSGCSQAVPVTVVENTSLTATTFALDDFPLDPAGSAQGKLITLTGTVAQPAAPPANGPAGPAVAYSGFVTFYDGTNVLALVPLANNQANYTNAFAGGAHNFSAVYSGDGSFQSSEGSDSFVVGAPADAVFYNGFEVPPGS